MNMPSTAELSRSRSAEGLSDGERRALREGWAQFLMEFDWAHKMDLTGRFPMSAERLHEAVAKLHRRLTRVAQGPVSAFLALERSAGDAYHGHALIAGTRHVAVARLQAAWHTGYSRVGRLRGPAAAVRHATKYAATNSADYAMLGRWERHRRGAGPTVYSGRK